VTAARSSEIRHRVSLRCGDLLGLAETARESALGEAQLLNAAARALIDGARASAAIYTPEADAGDSIAYAIVADARTAEDLMADVWRVALPAMQPAGIA